MEDLSIDEIKQGLQNKSDFKNIYHYYAPFVWRIIYRVVNSNTFVAEEVLQKVFISVYKNRKSFKFTSRFSTWIYQIAWREAVRENKKFKLFKSRHDEYRDITTVNRDNNKSDVYIILNRLTSEERFLLVSKDIEGFTFEELSQITGKSSSSLRVTLSRLRKKIREELQDEL